MSRSEQFKRKKRENREQSKRGSNNSSSISSNKSIISNSIESDPTPKSTLHNRRNTGIHNNNSNNQIKSVEMIDSDSEQSSDQENEESSVDVTNTDIDSDSTDNYYNDSEEDENLDMDENESFENEEEIGVDTHEQEIESNPPNDHTPPMDCESSDQLSGDGSNNDEWEEKEEINIDKTDDDDDDEANKEQDNNMFKSQVRPWNRNKDKNGKPIQPLERAYTKFKKHLERRHDTLMKAKENSTEKQAKKEITIINDYDKGQRKTSERTDKHSPAMLEARRRYNRSLHVVERCPENIEIEKIIKHRIKAGKLVFDIKVKGYEITLPVGQQYLEKHLEIMREYMDKVRRESVNKFTYLITRWPIFMETYREREPPINRA